MKRASGPTRKTESPDPASCGLSAESGPASSSVHAFTLIELLVVISIIAILAAMLLPVLSNAKMKGAQVACMNNLKQLASGLTMYLNDNQGVFPGMASRRGGFQPEDWIYWRQDDPSTPPVDKSPIVSMLGSANAGLFRCPMDKTDKDRLTFPYGDDQGMYPYSYSLTGYGTEGVNSGLTGNTNYGLSSFFRNDGNHRTVILFKETQVHNPVAKIMLAEEPGSLSSRDAPSGADAPPAELIQDGRWMPDRDMLTARHSGKADVAFVDGHLQKVDWHFGTDPINSRPDQ